MMNDHDLNNNGHHGLLQAALPIEQLVRAGRQLNHLEEIENYARSIAKAIRTDVYDAKNPDDKLREEQFQKDSEELQDAEKSAAHAAVIVRDAERQQADIQRSLVEPKPDWRITVPATAALAFSIAPTFHDQFFAGFDDKVLAWMISFLGGGLIGAFITWSLVGVLDSSGKRSTVNLVGLIGAVGVGLFTFLLRLSSGDLLSAIALTILEFSAVAMLEGHASTLREQYRQFSLACEGHLKAAAKVRTESAEAARRTRQLEEAKARVEAHKQYVAMRTFCAQKPVEIEQAALDIARKAHFARVADEERIRKGLPREVSL